MSILVCGEAIMDVFAQAETTMGLTLDARVGGSPFNVAVGLARLGQAVGFLGAFSNNVLGRRLRAALELEGVNLHHAINVDAPTTLAMVSLNDRGVAEYAFYGVNGAELQLLQEHLPLIGNDVAGLHFGSYSMVVGPVSATFRSLIKQVHLSKVISYDVNVRTKVEPDLTLWRDTLHWMSQYVQLLKLSDEDLEILYPGLSPEQFAKQCFEHGVQLVVVTAGSKGAFAFTRDNSVEVQTPKVDVIDSVGAGDTFQAALLSWLSENKLLNVWALGSLSEEQLTEAVSFGTFAAALTCTRRGADMPRREEIS